MEQVRSVEDAVKQTIGMAQKLEGSMQRCPGCKREYLFDLGALKPSREFMMVATAIASISLRISMEESGDPMEQLTKITGGGLAKIAETVSKDARSIMAYAAHQHVHGVWDDTKCIMTKDEILAAEKAISTGAPIISKWETSVENFVIITDQAAQETRIITASEYANEKAGKGAS